MTFAGINYLAVVVAAIASFGFSGLYYMALARPWMAALGKTTEDMRADRSRLPFIIAAIADLVMAWMVAGVLGHLGGGQVTPLNGVISGAFLWFGFVLTTTLVNYGFQRARPALIAIDTVHWLGVLAIQGLVIGAFGV